ncbi:MAG TPA: hypothetical protein PKB03_06060 [Baekduia sp.]|nr:hypothetical protein [Baekduia sp.]
MRQRRYWVYVVGPITPELAAAIHAPPLSRAVTPHTDESQEPHVTEEQFRPDSRQVCVDADSPEEAVDIVESAIVGLDAKVKGPAKLMLVRKHPSD